MFRYLKNVLVRGLMVMIPIIIVWITLRELFELMIGFATPIADLFPVGTFTEEDATEVVAGLLILFGALVIGLVWTLKPTRVVVEWAENQTLNRIPMYRMLKSLVAAFLDLEGESSFQPATLQQADGSLDPVYVIENHGDDMVVIMQPWTPTPFAGTIRVVPMDRVTPLDTTLDEYSLALTHFGLGLSENLRKADD